MSTEQIKVLLVDDHSIVCEGLRAILDKEPDMTAVGEASHGVAAVETYLRLRPDVTVMDLRMPLRSGVEATRIIRDHDPSARILVLSSYEGDEDIHSAIEAGAMGYLLKHIAIEKIVPAIRALMSGQRWLPPEVANRLLTRHRAGILTTREREIIHQLALGEANKEIASLFGITEETVKTHVSNILGKLQVRDRTEAVTVALRRGIIHLPEN